MLMMMHLTLVSSPEVPASGSMRVRTGLQVTKIAGVSMSATKTRVVATSSLRLMTPSPGSWLLLVPLLLSMKMIQWAVRPSASRLVIKL